MSLNMDHFITGVIGTGGRVGDKKGEQGCQMHPLYLSTYITPLLDLDLP